MKITYKSNNLSFKSLCLVGGLAVILATGCKKYLDLPLPVDSIAGEGAYSNDAAAAAVLNSIFWKLLVRDNGLIDGSIGVDYTTGLYTDELQNAVPSNVSNQTFYTNNIQSPNTSLLWTDLYQQVYACNLAIEGIQASSGLLYKNQWLGEALFCRSLIYFYLVNLYGDIPLSLSSASQTNNSLPRASKDDVNKQLIADLIRAKGLLSTDYRDMTGVTTTDRGRPNKLAATALLARVYLYTKDWTNARSSADSVIADTRYQLVTPDQVFLKASQENIWGLTPVASAYTVPAASLFLITPGQTPQASGVSVALNSSLVNSFEAGDARFTNWIGMSNAPAQGTFPATTYYFSNKYKTKGIIPAPVEYLMLLRLAEQYLIRAEARAQLSDITGAATDLNIVRTRAGLGATAAANQTDMLSAVLQERRVELFTEPGHRFFDLKRTGTIDAVMGAAAPLKGGNWASFMQYWPIPTADILADPNLTQTPGYQQ